MSAVKSAILKHLQADATIIALVGSRIYPGDVAPEGATFPLILVTMVKGEAPDRVYQRIAFEQGRARIKAMDKSTSPKAAHEINEAVRVSLDGGALTMTGYTVLNVEWMANIPGYTTLESSVHYCHEGSEYEVWATRN